MADSVERPFACTWQSTSLRKHQIFRGCFQKTSEFLLCTEGCCMDDDAEAFGAETH
jgi:hypothetical protein